MLTGAVSLGIDEIDNSNFTIDFYREYFEKPFLAATREYYLKESRKLLAENDVVEYTKKVLSKCSPTYIIETLLTCME